MKTIADVDHAEQQLGHEIDAYLRKRGWVNKCDNPASLWLWQKALPDGRVMMLSRDVALMVERATWDGGES